MNFHHKFQLSSKYHICVSIISILLTIFTILILLLPSPTMLFSKQHRISIHHNTPDNSTYKTCVYYSNWSIYSKAHYPSDIPLDKVTNVFYAFFNIDPNTGEVLISDSWADVEKPYDIEKNTDHSIEVSDGKVNGLFGKFFELKKLHRHVKTSMSIGGWSNRDLFTKGLDSDSKLDKFVDSSVKLLLQYGFDGIDLDWEYPSNHEESERYYKLFQRLRFKLDQIETVNKLPSKSLLLTIASPAFSEKLDILQINKMDEFISFWNLMTYDFGGSWSETANYHCNLYKAPHSLLCADDTINYFISKGIDSKKLVLGMANYGRTFSNTSGYGSSFQGVLGEDGGIIDYKSLSKYNFKQEYDSNAVIGYGYDSQKRVFISFDNVQSVRTKAKYVIDRKLGGGMWWESSGDDYTDPNRSLLLNFVESLGGITKLDKSLNTLNCYKESSYLQKNFDKN